MDGEAPAWDTEKGKILRHNIDSVILTTFWNNPDTFLKIPACECGIPFSTINPEEAKFNFITFAKNNFRIERQRRVIYLVGLHGSWFDR
jgi:hypothetical protein